jgi:hypothetical protein
MVWDDMITKGYWVSFVSDKNILKLIMMMMVNCDY